MRRFTIITRSGPLKGMANSPAIKEALVSYNAPHSNGFAIEGKDGSIVVPHAEFVQFVSEDADVNCIAPDVDVIKRGERLHHDWNEFVKAGASFVDQKRGTQEGVRELGLILPGSKAVYCFLPYKAEC